MVDYRDFKTPFYKIKVGRGKDSPDQYVELSPQLMRLVERVEIIETLGQECKSTVVANIVFREGSREPYPQEGNLPDNNLYDNATELLSNTTGMLADLVFDSQFGLKAAVNLVENALGQVISVEDSIAASQSGLLSIVSPEEIEIEQSSIDSSEVEYLFHQNNRVEVTWGYLESQLETTQRTVSLIINTVKVTYPENGSISVIITGTDASKILDRYVPSVPTVFALSVPFSENITMTTKEVFIKLQTMFSNIEFTVSDDLLAESLDKGKAYVWIAGQSLMEFLWKFARRHHAYVDTRIDTKTGKFLVYLMNRRDYDKLRLKEDINLFYYKHPQSILKSVDLMYQASDTGAMFAGTDDSGNQVKLGSEYGENAQLKVEMSAQYVTGDISKTDKSAKELKNKISPKGAITNVEMTPEANDKQVLKDRAASRAACQVKNTIALDFISLGLPALRPIVVNFGGLGKRFSGPYKVTMITHIIDASGYVCRGIATSNLDYGSTQQPNKVSIPGVNNPDLERINITENPLNTLGSNADPVVEKHDASVLNKDNSLFGLGGSVRF